VTVQVLDGTATVDARHTNADVVVVQPRTGRLLLLALLELARVDNVHRTATAGRSEVAPVAAAAAALVRHPAVLVLMLRPSELARPRLLDRVFVHVLVQRKQQKPEHDN